MLSFLRKGSSAPAAAPKRLNGLSVIDASSEKSDEDCAHNILTADRDETWHAGCHATPDHTQWVDLELGPSGAHVSHVSLLPYQVPNTAHTHHRIWLGDSKESMQVVADVQNETRHHQPMPDIQIGRDGKFMRIETVESPSWVAWSKVELFGDMKG